MAFDDHRALSIGGGVVAALLLAGVIAVFATGGDGDDVASEGTTTTSTIDASASPDESRPDDSTESPETSVDTGSAGAPPAQTPAETTVAPSPTGSTAPPNEDLGPAQDPGPTSPPRAGVYRYKTTGEDGNSAETDTTISDVSRTNGEVVQKVEASGGGFQGVDTFVWTSDRVVVSHSVYTFGGDEADCDWEPDVVYARLPLKKSLSWESTSTCSVSGFTPAPIVVTRQQTGKVVDLVRRRIAGEVLDLWVIEADLQIDAGTFNVEAQTTNWFSPKHGLIVRTEGSGSGGTPTQSGGGSFTSEILDLSPR